jgi:hypothetical protein
MTGWSFTSRKTRGKVVRQGRGWWGSFGSNSNDASFSHSHPLLPLLSRSLLPEPFFLARVTPRQLAMRLFSSSLLLAVSLGVSTVVALPTSTDSPSGISLSRRQAETNSTATTVLPPPSVDPFYDAPAGYQRTKNGGVLKARNVTTALDQLSKAYQVLYKTTDASGNPDATVALVFAPLQPVSPPKIMLYLGSSSFLLFSPFCDLRSHSFCSSRCFLFCLLIQLPPTPPQSTASARMAYSRKLRHSRTSLSPPPPLSSSQLFRRDGRLSHPVRTLLSPLSPLPVVPSQVLRRLSSVSSQLEALCSPSTTPQTRKALRRPSSAVSLKLALLSTVFERCSTSEPSFLRLAVTRPSSAVTREAGIRQVGRRSS